MKIDINSVFKKNIKIAYRIIDDEAVLVLADKGEVVHLNPTATIFWEGLDGKAPLKKIVKKICVEFDIKQSQAEEDICEIAKKMLKETIIEKSD